MKFVDFEPKLGQLQFFQKKNVQERPFFKKKSCNYNRQDS